MEQGAPRGRPPFPGMDPWLERSDLWPDVHNSLIVSIRDQLAPRLRPRYFVGIESRTTVLSGLEMESVYEPDVATHAMLDVALEHVDETDLRERGQARTIDVAILAEDIVETYLTIRELPGRKLVTVLEVLSPTNKKSRAGRAEYLDKRSELVRGRINFMEIDLLRGGDPMPSLPAPPPDDYRILICLGRPRRKATVTVFPWTAPIPTLRIPLLPGDLGPELDLNSILHNLYERASYDLLIDYHQPPPKPPLREADAAWAAAIIAGTREDGPRSRTGTGPGPSDPAVSREAQP